MDGDIKENCGVFGGYGHQSAAKMARLGLFFEQHRGQESVGIAVADGAKTDERLRIGLVSDQMSYEDCAKLKGYIVSGHVRYSTAGGSNPKNIQPLLVEVQGEKYYFSHNGNIRNSTQLKNRLESENSIFSTTTDSEIFPHLMVRSKATNVEDRLIDACSQINGSYSLLVMTKNSLIGVRDPQGFRPLILGKKDGAYFLASESPAFEINGIEYLRDIKPGEMIIFDEESSKTAEGFRSRKITEKEVTPAECVFEQVYFRRPDSRLWLPHTTTWNLRYRMGIRLAQEHPIDADIVGSVPDSGNSAAEGFSFESKIPINTIFVRSHYVGRTFILPENDIRKNSVDLKLAVNTGAVYGKRVVVVDDSIVRGNTTKGKVADLRRAGAKEIHLRISCPQVRFPCYYGIDYPTSEELIANKMLTSGRVDIEKLAEYLEADSVGYLSLEGLLWACEPLQTSFCSACFNGKYPTSEVEN